MNFDISEILSTLAGGTVDLTGRPVPSFGYVVGGAGIVLNFPSESAVDAMLVAEYFQRTSSDMIGWWTDQETGKVWFDEVSWTDSYTRASDWARQRGEIAFFDIAEDDEVRVDYGRKLAPCLSCGKTPAYRLGQFDWCNPDGYCNEAVTS